MPVNFPAILRPSASHVSFVVMGAWWTFPPAHPSLQVTVQVSLYFSSPVQVVEYVSGGDGVGAEHATLSHFSDPLYFAASCQLSTLHEKSACLVPPVHPLSQSCVNGGLSHVLVPTQPSPCELGGAGGSAGHCFTAHSSEPDIFPFFCLSAIHVNSAE